MTYKVTLINTATQDELFIDIEQTDAFAAQEVAQNLYKGYRVVAIADYNPVVVGDIDYRHTEGALGDDLDF